MAEVIEPSNASVSNTDVYIQTTTHNYVSRKAVIEGARQVELKGRSIIEGGCKLDGSQTWIRVGRYTHIQMNTSIVPPPMPGSTTKYVPTLIGSHTIIGKNCQIQAAAIGSHCWVGNNVKLGRRVIIKDCCIISDNVDLGDDTVIAPFTLVQQTGSYPWTPPNYVELPPSTALELQERTMETFQAMVKQQGKDRNND